MDPDLVCNNFPMSKTMFEGIESLRTAIREEARPTDRCGRLYDGQHQRSVSV